MKKLRTFNPRWALLWVLFFSALSALAQPRSRVVINEFMPWPSAGCGVTSEFIELYNFGPLAADISCYILTDGDYAITIPPNTVLKPGQYYLISGQKTLPVNCGNVDSLVRVDLNWNFCGCTSSPIPTTEDGFLTDGGAASEQLVLLDPNLKVIDAVVRDASLKEPSSPILTSTVGGGCTPKLFNLDTMAIQYETIGISAGRSNSFARAIDGDCKWVKQTQISAKAPNKGSATSEVSYDLNIVDSRDCPTTYGSIEINVNYNGDYAAIFPMKYTIIHDTNGNEVFDFEDDVTVSYDSTAPSIYINFLMSGRYSITVESKNGCYLKNFKYTILPCDARVLPVHLLYFKEAEQTAQYKTLEWKLADVEHLASVQLEKSRDGVQFVPEKIYTLSGRSGAEMFQQAIAMPAASPYFRLLLKGRDGKITYSPVINTREQKRLTPVIGPNPARNFLNLEIPSPVAESALYRIISSTGTIAARGQLTLQAGTNNLQVSLQHLPAGVYQLVVEQKSSGTQPISFRFVKQ